MTPRSDRRAGGEAGVPAAPAERIRIETLRCHESGRSDIYEQVPDDRSPFPITRFVGGFMGVPHPRTTHPGHPLSPPGAPRRFPVLCLYAISISAGCVAVERGPGPAVAPELPAVRVEGAPERTVTLSELRSGIAVPFEIVVPRETGGLRAAPLDGAGCQRADANGLMPFPVVTREAQVVYCPACDVGYCSRPRSGEGPAPRVGVHRYTFRWNGESTFGPSHHARTPARAEAPRVAPGVYRVSIRAAFAAGDTAARKVETSVVLRVVP